MKAEIVRRQSLAEKVVGHFRARPYQWVRWQTLRDLVGERAYRTRLSNAREVFCEEQGLRFPVGKKDRSRDPLPSRTRELDGQILTEYRYLPNVIGGRDASDLHAAVPVPLPLYDGEPGAFQR